MKATVFALFLCSINHLVAQEYWQQQVDYTIEVTLDDSNHLLNGFESIDYLNKSPDTLEYLIFHLWPKAYSRKNSALAKQLTRMGETDLYFASSDEMGDMDSLSFTIDGLPCVWSYNKKYLDICTLQLERPLNPGQKVKIETPFRVRIPSGTISRLGHLGESYQITQWYPKPAVYDRTGWHGMPYLTIGEFYSEYGSYDVKISLPDNYTVGATGDLQTQSEIDRLESLSDKTKSWLEDRRLDSRWKEFSENLEFPTSSKQFKTLHYRQENVHDFAWFADKRFHVLKGSLDLPHSSNSVDVWTMFTNKHAKHWSQSIEYMKDAIHYYSLWNGDYPYAQATAIDGTISAGGGMEYPNVTVIGDAQSAVILETVIMHEVGHNWFYGVLGSNERDFAWMDEGLNSYNEQRYLSTKYPNGYLFFGNSSSKLLQRFGFSDYGMKDLHYFSYLLSARANSDQALSISSGNYSAINYGTIVYSKSAVFFNYLRHYLGDEKMDRAMQAYFEAYKFKHPQPDDFFMILEKETEEDFSWFRQDVLQSTSKLDYKIGRVRKQDGIRKLKLSNRGYISGPVQIGLFEDGKLDSTFWMNGFRNDTLIQIDNNTDRVEIDPNWIMPEIKRDNNYSNLSGLFPRIEPLEVSFLGKIENPKKNQVSWTPAFAWNVPNGFMLGVSLYNSILPVKKFNYLITPMYSIQRNQVVGVGEAYYMLKPTSSSFESIDLGLKAKRFVYDTASNVDLNFTRIEPYLRFNFRPANYNGYWSQELTLSAVFVQSDAMNGTQKTSSNEVFSRANYSAKYKHPAFNTSISGDVEFFDEFLKASLEVNNRWRVTEDLQLCSRLFGGHFLFNNAVDPKYNWRMDGQTGRNDYAFDAMLFDRSRSSAVFGNQYVATHGGFKLPTANGSSNASLLSYNAELSYGKVPIGVFGDHGYTSNNTLVADGGLYIRFIQDVFKVYFPLLYSSNIQSEIDANGYNLGDLVRFQIDFNKLNILDFRRNLGI